MRRRETAASPHQYHRTRRLELTGKQFGRLTVLRLDRVEHDSRWLCKCECGQHIMVRGNALNRGRTKSCGCFNRDNPARFTHGHSHLLAGKPSREYKSYQMAKNRCTNPHCNSYPNYGGRGIQFRFEDFAEFMAELGPRPSGMTLDRINNDGHYEKGNVRWATWKQQAHNKRKPKEGGHQ